jgi:hypothetical protein
MLTACPGRAPQRERPTRQFDVSTSPYGPQDEIGRLNEMTPASRQRVLARVDGGTVFDLSVVFQTWI